MGIFLVWATPMHTVYILKCGDGGFYVGCTDDLENRLIRHKNGYIPATKYRLPVELVVSINFQDKYKAYAFEKYLKSEIGRAFTKKRF